MKSIMLLTSLLLSFSVFADSASFAVSSFTGELKIEPADLKIQEVVVVANLQFCNVWGTTCAGGPSEEKETVASFKQDSATNLVSIKTSALKVVAMKPMNRFSSCKLNIYLTGKAADGSNYRGSTGLLWENNKDNCKSLSLMNEKIAEALKVPKRVMMLKSSY